MLRDGETEAEGGDGEHGRTAFFLSRDRPRSSHEEEPRPRRARDRAMLLGQRKCDGMKSGAPIFPRFVAGFGNRSIRGTTAALAFAHPPADFPVRNGRLLRSRIARGSWHCPSRRWPAPPLDQTIHHGQLNRPEPAWKPNSEDDTDFSDLIPPEWDKDEEGPGSPEKGNKQASDARDG